MEGTELLGVQLGDLSLEGKGQRWWREQVHYLEDKGKDVKKVAVPIL